MSYQFNYTGEKIEEILNKAENLSALYEAGQLGGGGGGGSEWEIAGTSSSLSTDGTTGITGLTDENTEYLCRIRAHVGSSVWDYTITLARGSGASNIRNGAQVWLNMNSIDWMNVDAFINYDGTAKVLLYSGTTDITATLAPRITEIAIYKRSITS